MWYSLCNPICFINMSTEPSHETILFLTTNKHVNICVLMNDKLVINTECLQLSWEWKPFISRIWYFHSHSSCISWDTFLSSKWARYRGQVIQIISVRKHCLYAKLSCNSECLNPSTYVLNFGNYSTQAPHKIHKICF